ncbi:hypothetical protein MMC25_000695 [Agyrium rufum]|nr:hypothetical protein [Agyrium rufum]
MQIFPLVTFLVTLLSTAVTANVEKVVFLGPSAVSQPPLLEPVKAAQHAVLSPTNSLLRTDLKASFNDSSGSVGTEHWLALEDLPTGQRFEVRICWSATQPTSFYLDIFELDEVFSSPGLSASFSDSHPLFSVASKQQQAEHPSTLKITKPAFGILLLRIGAKADYYSLNQDLMKNVPLVKVDIILDPFVLNVLPRSLVPTVIYIIVLAGIGWVVTLCVWKILGDLAAFPTNDSNIDTVSDTKKSR